MLKMVNVLRRLMLAPLILITMVMRTASGALVMVMYQ